MKLSVNERYVLLDLLPREGSYATLKILRQLRENLSFSEEEHKQFNITEKLNENGTVAVTWNSGDNETDIPMGEKATDIICASLKKLDEAHKLTEREFSLCEKFLI